MSEQILADLNSRATVANTQLTKVKQYLNNALLLANSGSQILKNKINDLIAQQTAIAAKNQELLQNLQSGEATPGEYANLVQQLSQLNPSFPALKELLNSDLSGSTPNTAEIKNYLQQALGEAKGIPLADLQNLSNELVRSSKLTPGQTLQTTSGPTSGDPQAKPATDAGTPANAPAENWGVKFNFTAQETMAAGFAGPANQTQNNYYLSLLPAMATQLPMQGAKDVPGSMPGLSFKIVPSVAKLKVPGFQPVFQHLGMDTLLVTMVGCFTGADGAQLLTDTQSKSKGITSTALGAATLFDSYGVPGKSGEEGLREIASKLDSYRNFQEFYQFAVLQGRELNVEINLAKNSPVKVDQNAGDKPLRAANGNPRFKALVKSMEVYHARSDRTWYTIQLEMTDFGLAGDKPINLTHTLDSQIKAAQAVKLNQALKEEVDEFRAMQNKLNTVKYEQSVLDDGNYLYQFSDGTSVLQYINKGAVDFKQVSGTELEELKKRVQGKTSAGDWLKLGAAGIGCGIGVVTAPTGVGALLAAGACGVVGGLTVKDTIESDATVQEGAVDVVLTGATLGVGSVVGGLAKNAGNIVKAIPGASQVSNIANLAKNLPGVSQIGNLAKNLPGATQIGTLAQSAGNLVSGTGNLIRENGAKILRVIPNQGTVKQFMDTTGKLLFEPGAWRSPSIVSATNGVKTGIAKAFETINPFKAKVPPISTGTAVQTSTAVVTPVTPVAAATPPVTPVRNATSSSATSLIYSGTRHDPVK